MASLNIIISRYTPESGRWQYFTTWKRKMEKNTAIAVKKNNLQWEEHDNAFNPAPRWATPRQPGASPPACGVWRTNRSDSHSLPVGGGNAPQRCVPYAKKHQKKAELPGAVGYCLLFWGFTCQGNVLRPMWWTKAGPLNLKFGFFPSQKVGRDFLLPLVMYVTSLNEQHEEDGASKWGMFMIMSWTRSIRALRGFNEAFGCTSWAFPTRILF